MSRWFRLRIYILLAAFATVLVVVIIEVLDVITMNKARQSNLSAATQATDLKNPDDSGVTVEQPLQVINLEVTSKTFDGVPVRLYRPIFNTSRKHLLPAVIFFHGGGWMYGSVESRDSYTRKIAMNTGLLVVSVEYRLAPKYQFPIPLDDCHKATLYVHKNALKLGVDASKVIPMGDSAGGNLAAAVSQRMKDTKPPLLAQILIYPVMQSMNLQLPSHEAYRQDWAIPMFLSYFLGSVNKSLADAMLHGSHVSDQVRLRYSKYVDYLKLPESFRKDYVVPAGIKVDPTAAKILEPFITNPEINPLVNEDLTGLPHTMIVTVGFDCLRDDGLLYAIRLKEAGIPVQQSHYEDGRHGAFTDGDDPPPDSAPARVNSDVFEYIRSRVSS